MSPTINIQSFHEQYNLLCVNKTFMKTVFVEQPFCFHHSIFLKEIILLVEKGCCPKQTANEITALQNRAPDTTMAQNGMKMCFIFCLMHSKFHFWWNDWFLMVSDRKQCYLFIACIVLRYASLFITFYRGKSRLLDTGGPKL